MPVLAAMAEKVFARHRHTNPELGKLRELVEALKIELLAHISKEEQVVFLALRPWKTALPGVPACQVILDIYWLRFAGGWKSMTIPGSC